MTEMATITASDVNKLRQQTGLGMMDCKSALVEANGDFEKAVEILRKKGQKVAEKRSDREASEGYVIAKTNSNQSEGIIMVLNCETDFVAKNDAFVDFANQIADLALSSKAANAEAVLALPLNDKNVGENIIEQIGKIGEKIEISDYAYINAGSVVAYNHPGNKVASLVGLTAAGEVILDAGRDVAMQIAAMAPIAVDKDGVSKDIIEKEIEIGKEQARNEGKPEEILEKIALGKLNKFYQERTLLNQEFIKDSKKTVKQYLQSVDNGLTVSAFKRISLQ
jgi:elongation factor Ts